MSFAGVEHGLRLVKATEEVASDLRVASLLRVVHRLADVVQQPGPARQSTIKAQFVGDHLRKIRDFQ